MGSQRGTFFLIQPPLTPSPTQEILGRFHGNPQEPTFTFAPSDPQKLKRILSRLNQLPVEEDIIPFHRQSTHFNGNRVQAQLAGIFGLARFLDDTAIVTVRSPRAIVRKAQQIPRYFDDLLKDETILRELTDMLRENNGVAYMAVATLTMSDVELTIEQNVTNIVRTNTGDGFPIAPQSPVDGGASQGSQSRREERYTSPGMRIVGISYMKVTKRRFVSRVELNRNPVPAGKDAVYGDGNKGRRSRGGDRKEYDSTDIFLEPLSPDSDEQARDLVSITLDF